MEGSAEEVVDSAHEVNLDTRCSSKGTFEEFFLFWILTEEHKVVIIQANVNQRRRVRRETSDASRGVRMRRRSVWIIDKSREETRIVGGGGKANFGEYGGDHVVPMVRTAVEVVERLFEKPEFFFV